MHNHDEDTKFYSLAQILVAAGIIFAAGIAVGLVLSPL